MAGHNFNTNTENEDEWLTPKYITDALGQFDLDPCAPTPETRPWDIANKNYSILDDGLSQEWIGRVWCNPPYGRQTFEWINKLAAHGNGIALIFTRTETKGFHEHIWNRADGIFFFEGRLKFCRITGKVDGTANAPSCLVCYGENNMEYVRRSILKGKLIQL